MDTKIIIDKFKLNSSVLSEGVYILSEVIYNFESIYLKVREKEKRIYADDELINLPFASEFNPHRKEWNLRAKSFHRFRKHLGTKDQKLDVLDLGCGNGWFCGKLSQYFNHNFYCVDVNFSELGQGRRVFNSDNLNFIYADIFSTEFPASFCDLVILNAAVQYFPDLKRLLDRLLSLTNENGEIHIIDSPFYSKNEIDNAKKRTENYYQTMNFPEMTKNYFHHSFEELSDYNHSILFNPHSFLKKVGKLFSLIDSPFPWIRIKK